MFSVPLRLAAAVFVGLSLTACAHDGAIGRSHMMMMSNDMGCAMQGRGDDGGREKEMSGCRMMGDASKAAQPTARASADADPHADHHPD